MGIFDNEEKLFNEWREHLQKHYGIENFIADGLADPVQFEKSTPKTLFVLKEGNLQGTSEQDKVDFDLRQYMRAGARSATWDNVSRWALGISKNQREVPWEKLKNIRREQRINILKSIGMMNLKKSSGEDVANMKNVANASERDAEFLQRQFSLYKPDIVICGGTFHLFRWNVLAGKSLDPLETSNGTPYFMDDNNAAIIDYHHPSARCGPNVLANTIIHAVYEIRIKHNIGLC